MATSTLNAETVLAIDIGTIHTRGMLYDVVEGNYRLIASGAMPSTVDAPFFDVSESIHQVLLHLQEVTGRELLDKENQSLILPSVDGSGVDRMAVTISAGSKLNLVITGLLPDVSLESAQRLAASIYGDVVESIYLTDTREKEEQIDAILRAKPDLVLMAGGTEEGATRSVLTMVEVITMVCRLLPEGKRPVIIYAGNQRLGERITKALEKLTAVYSVPNIRPTIDSEDLDAAQHELAEIIGLIRSYQIGGLEDLYKMSGVAIMPTAYTFGRMIRYLSRISTSPKSVLGLDVGAGSTTIAAAQRGRLMLSVLPYGLGSGVAEVLRSDTLEPIRGWLTQSVPDDILQDYFWQKTLYPASIPMTEESLAIEEAFTRHVIQLSMRQAAGLYPALGRSFEPIIASGSMLSHGIPQSRSLLMLLDGLQPVGVSTVALDINNTLASLGSIARINQVLPAQVIDGGVLLNLGTVICPVSEEKPGKPVMKVKLEYESGGNVEVEARQGTIQAIPLKLGQAARVHMTAYRTTQIDLKSGSKTGGFRVTGGVFGIIIDARGRPFVLPPSPAERQSLYHNWNAALMKGSA